MVRNKNFVLLFFLSSPHRAKSLRTPSNILVINLAICDFFMMFKTPVFIYNSFMRGFALGNLGCQIYGIIGSYTGIGASATNAFIAYDRYNVITRPLEGKMTQGKALLMVIFIYLYATPFVVACVTESWGRFVPGMYVLISFYCREFNLTKKNKINRQVCCDRNRKP